MKRPSPKKNKPSSNIQIIDLVRTLAILPVFALHLKPSLPLPSPFFRWGWDRFQRNGGYGVTMFFVISGFLITKVLAESSHGPFNPSWKEFYTRRTARILPLFLFVLLLGLVFYFTLMDSSKKFAYCFQLPSNPWDWTFWISLLLFIFNWARCFRGTSWHEPGGHWGIFWSLAVEEQFYFFYPLILSRMKNVRNLVIFLSSVILFGLIWRWAVFTLPAPDWIDWRWSSFGCFDQIAMGALLYFSQKKFGGYLRREIMRSFGLVITGSMLLVLTYFGTFIAEKPDAIYGPFLISAGLCLFLQGGFNLNWFESKHLKILTFPGKYSYGNYLFHISVLYFINSFLWNLNIVVAFFLFTAVSTSVSALSYHGFEVPANRWVRKMLSSSLKASPAAKLS